MTNLDEIRTEYMRGLSDAYNGGPSGREASWQRLAELIDTYAQGYSRSQAAPTMTGSTDTKPKTTPARRTRA